MKMNIFSIKGNKKLQTTIDKKELIGAKQNINMNIQSEILTLTQIPQN